MPIRIFWSNEQNKTSIWNVSCPLASIGSDGVKILWFTIGRGKKKKRKLTKKQKITHKKKSEPKKTVEEKPSGKKFDFAKIEEIWHNRKTFEKIVHALYIFIKKLVVSFKFDKSNSLSIKLSLERPDFLGIICGVIYPIIYSSPKLKWIRFEPDFERFEDDAQIHGKIRLNTRFYRIIFVLIILLWKIPKVELYRLWRENRNKRKR